MSRKTIFSCVVSVLMTLPLFGQDLTVNYRSRTIDQVIEDLESKTNYTFVYQKTELSEVPRISVSLQNAPFADVVARVCDKAGLSYEIIKNSVVLRKGEPAPVDKNIKVAGKVTDRNGLPIIGASVFEVGTSNGVSTDVDGNYTISVTKGALLTYSCIGYSDANRIASEGIVNVALSDDTTLLEETVVVGYGSMKKVNLSGSVSSVKMDEVLGDRPQPNAAAALSGAIPGLFIGESKSGMPQPGGTNKTIQIRGTTTFSGDTGNKETASGITPLILIDNVPGDFDSLNPNDIESVTVLKDASASAIYGARAAAGVILITTKHPEKGSGPKINYSYGFGLLNTVSTPHQVKLNEYLDAYSERLSGTNTWRLGGLNISKWREYYNLYNGNRSGLDALGKLYDGGVFVADADKKAYYLDDSKDQYQRALETGQSHNHNISVSGSGNKVSYRISSNIYKENGPLYDAKDTYARNSINGMISSEITDWFTQELEFMYSQQKKNLFEPIYKDFYNARYFFNFIPDAVSPQNGYKYRTMKNVIDMSNPWQTTIDSPRVFSKSIINPLKGLEVVMEYTYTKSSFDDSYYQGRGTLTYGDEKAAVLNKGIDKNTSAFASEGRNSLNLYGTYKYDLATHHHFSLMAGFSQEHWKYKKVTTTAESIPVLEIPSMGSATGTKTVNDVYNEYAIRSGYFRFNYNYKEKYIAEVSGRYDGSSKFPQSHRFGFFPSFSVAWNAAKEPWLASSKAVTTLKPRFSYGKIGNEASAGYYDYLATMSIDASGTNWLYGNENGYVTNISSPALVSDNYSWEEITTANIGLDFGFFNNQLTGSFEAYRRDTDKILSTGVNLPSVLGTKAPLQNVGSIRTNGWEFSIGWKGQIGSKVQYGINFNITDYYSTVTRINSNESKAYKYLYEGKTLGEIWGYEFDRFYTVDDFADLSTWKLKDGVPYYNVKTYAYHPGDFLYKNLRDGDTGESDVNLINEGKNTVDQPGDKTIIGNELPRYQYGGNFNIGYAGFNLSMMFQGVGKRDYSPGNNLYFLTFLSVSEANLDICPVYTTSTDYWRPINTTDPSSPDYWRCANPDTAKLPRIYGADQNSFSPGNKPNSKMLTSAAYFRIKNVTLSYTFPRKMLDRIYMKGLRLYVSCENLATFSALPGGIDPEIMDWAYPMSRVTSFGLNITL